jgi:hypothetical protein
MERYRRFHFFFFRCCNWYQKPFVGLNFGSQQLCAIWELNYTLNKNSTSRAERSESWLQTGDISLRIIEGWHQICHRMSRARANFWQITFFFIHLLLLLNIFVHHKVSQIVHTIFLWLIFVRKIAPREKFVMGFIWQFRNIKSSVPVWSHSDRQIELNLYKN